MRDIPTMLIHPKRVVHISSNRLTQIFFSIVFVIFSVENIAEGLQQQQEDIVVLDTKVGATERKVVKIDTKVTELNKDVAELGEGLDKVVERVDVVEDDMGDAKIKMEELDNKVNMSRDT